MECLGPLRRPPLSRCDIAQAIRPRWASSLGNVGADLKQRIEALFRSAIGYKLNGATQAHASANRPVGSRLFGCDYGCPDIGPSQADTKRTQ